MQQQAMAKALLMRNAEAACAADLKWLRWLKLEERRIASYIKASRKLVAEASEQAWRRSASGPVPSITWPLPVQPHPPPQFSVQTDESVQSRNASPHLKQAQARLDSLEALLAGVPPRPISGRPPLSYCSHPGMLFLRTGLEQALLMMVTQTPMRV